MSLNLQTLGLEGKRCWALEAGETCIKKNSIYKQLLDVETVPPNLLLCQNLAIAKISTYFFLNRYEPLTNQSTPG